MPLDSLSFTLCLQPFCWQLSFVFIPSILSLCPSQNLFPVFVDVQEIANFVQSTMLKQKHHFINFHFKNVCHSDKKLCSVLLRKQKTLYNPVFALLFSPFNSQSEISTQVKLGHSIVFSLSITNPISSCWLMGWCSPFWNIHSRVFYFILLHILNPKQNPNPL